jgi:hypothetical protein
MGYKKTDGVWFPSERKYYGNGKLYQHTKYEQVRFSIELDPAIFDPDNLVLITGLPLNN